LREDEDAVSVLLTALPEPRKADERADDNAISPEMKALAISACLVVGLSALSVTEALAAEVILDPSLVLASASEEAFDAADLDEASVSDASAEPDVLAGTLVLTWEVSAGGPELDSTTVGAT